MVVCRFYQQGYCRYGNHCRFEHPRNPSYNSSRYAPSYQSNYNATGTNYNRFGTLANDNRGKLPFGQTQVNTIGQVTFTEFVNVTIQEIDAAIKGKQWPFSCFSVQKDCESWPGVDDISPEELRYEAYQYQQQGRMDIYVQGVTQLTTSTIAKKNEIKSRSPAVLDLLKRIYQGEKIGHKPTSAPFGYQALPTGKAIPFQFISPQLEKTTQQPQISPQFEQANAATTTFGQFATSSWPTVQVTSQTSNIFGTNTFQAAPTFGQPQHQNVFGSPTAPQFPPENDASLTSSQNVTQINKSQGADETYTATENLTQEEREQFTASTFTLGRIPFRPPPQELC